MCLLSLVSTRTSGVPIIFSANLRISLMARGALFLKPLQEHGPSFPGFEPRLVHRDGAVRSALRAAGLDGWRGARGAAGGAAAAPDRERLWVQNVSQVRQSTPLLNCRVWTNR